MVIIQVTGTNSTYSAFIPNPPITIAMSWGDTHIPVVVNQSSWLPGPSDKRGPSQPMEEGRVIDAYTVGVQGFSICMGVVGAAGLFPQPGSWPLG